MIKLLTSQDDVPSKLNISKANTLLEWNLSFMTEHTNTISSRRLFNKLSLCLVFSIVCVSCKLDKCKGYSAMAGPNFSITEGSVT